MKKIYKSFPRKLIVAGVALTLTGCLSDADSPSWVDPEVVAVNQIPTIESSPVITAQTDRQYSYSLSATDGDSEDTLSLSASVIPDWLTFDSTTGMLSGTPTTADIGDHEVTLVASDGNDELSQTFTITVAAATSGGNWTMVWSDEFDGSTLNTENWNIQSGDGTEFGLTAWGNNEEEWYQAENITVADGNLVITAKEEASNGYPYTSGRMRSDNKVDIKYGRIEARVKTPVGQGLWSAFWMLPTDSQYGGWASGGEIDIMEAVSPGETDDITYGTLHYGMPWPLNTSAGGNADRSPIDDFHTYAIEWEQDEIRWFIDDIHYATVTSDTWWSYFYGDDEQGYVSEPEAPFNQEFHLLFNLAVGGNWPGSPNSATVFPAEMLVDYVRVYQCDSDNESGAGCANNVNSTVVPSAPASVYVASQTLFDDGISPLSWQVNEETVTRELQAAVAWDNGGIVVVEQDVGGDHGVVLDINTGDKGNIAISATDGEIFDLFGMGNSAEWWKLAAGEIKFDLYIDSAVTPADSNITIKMDSGWPALGFKTLAVADLAQDTWITLSVPINDLTANPGDQALNTAAIVNLFIIEFSAAAHIQVDNIQVVCGHKNNNGCGIKAPSVEIDTEVLEVFIDSVNESVWTNGAGGWDNGVNSDYYTGDTSNHVNWQLVESGETGHDTILDVTFNADGDDGVFYIQSGQPVDLNSFSSGSLIFDIKSNTAGFTYKVDCISPCGTGDRSLNVVGDGEWQTITIAVSDLVSQGLNLNSTNTGLVIFPTWGDQQGISFQLDNIRWQLGESTPPAEEDPATPPADNTGGIDGDLTVVGTPFDFESGGLGSEFTWAVFENEDNPALEFVANPAASSVNDSAMVAKFTARQSGKAWAGTETAGATGVFTMDATNSIVKIMVYKSVISDVALKFSVGTAAQPEIKVANTKVDEWEELTFDFTGRIGLAETIGITSVIVFPDFNGTRAADTVNYFDNITFGSIED